VRQVADIQGSIKEEQDAMNGKTRLVSIGAVATALTFAAVAHCEANASSLEEMAGMWQVTPRGPNGGPLGPPGAGQRRGGPPPEGARRGTNFGEGPPAGARGGRFGPPPGGPEGDASDLPGPDIEGLDRGDKMMWAIMTPAGKAAFEAMDPHDLPANNCKSNGLPSLVGIPDVQEWSFAGDVLTIHYANFDTVRTIQLDGSTPSGAPSLYGYSSGVFADGELTVTTTNLIATPGGFGRNAPGSGSRTYVEHYRLSADGQSVSGYVTIHDPEYLTRDVNVPIAFGRAAEGTTIPDDVGCSVEASQRYLNDG